MDYRRMGRTGLKVSEICLGCMTFGGGADESEAQRMVDYALDAGVNFFDTANVYQKGGAEEILGRAIQEKRSKVVIATKAWGRIGDGPNDSGSARVHLFQAVEASLRRLGTDYIDLYQVHIWDKETPIDETLRAFDDLVRQGKVRYIGCANFAAWHLCKSLWISDTLNLARFDCAQMQYSLICRDIERETLPLCQTEGVGVIAWSPLGMGILTGKYQKGQPPPVGTRAHERAEMMQHWLTDRNFEAAEQLQRFAAKREKPPSQIALRWVLDNEIITSAIVGARSLDQLKENLGCLGWRLSPEEKAQLDEISRIEEGYPYQFIRTWRR
jgi:aryl-alcohol dehydrogenase-like predicted oxidoreductase